MARSGEVNYDMSFTTFNGGNANNLWALNLRDNNNSGMENGLVSWTMTVDSVPEPITYALAGFGLIFVGGTAGRHYFLKAKKRKS